MEQQIRFDPTESVETLRDTLAAYGVMIVFVLQHLPLIDALAKDDNDSTLLVTLKRNIVGPGLSDGARAIALKILEPIEAQWNDLVAQRNAGEKGSREVTVLVPKAPRGDGHQ
jgi:hypothetical protein